MVNDDTHVRGHILHIFRQIMACEKWHSTTHFKILHIENLSLHIVWRRPFKGIVHLNIIFSYMKVNKIRNLDHPVY